MIEDDQPILDVPAPCPVAWSSMSGEGTARTCEQCKRAVHDFTVLSATQIQSLLSDPSKRVCARVDVKAAHRLGAHHLGAVVFATALTSVGIAYAAAQSDSSTPARTAIRGVVHAGEQPLSGVEVRAKPAGRGDGATTKTDAGGAYDFANLAPGLYVISFDSHRPNAQASDVAVEVCKSATVVLDTNAEDYSHVIGEVVTTGTRRPRDATATDPHLSAISGRVSSQKIDEGIAGATVNLHRSRDGLRKTAHTDALGRYAFLSLEPGRYELTGTAKGFLTQSIEYDLQDKPHWNTSSPGPSSIDPEDLKGDIALCPRSASK